MNAIHKIALALDPQSEDDIAAAICADLRMIQRELGKEHVPAFLQAIGLRIAATFAEPAEAGLFAAITEMRKAEYGAMFYGDTDAFDGSIADAETAAEGLIAQARANLVMYEMKMAGVL